MEKKRLIQLFFVVFLLIFIGVIIRGAFLYINVKPSQEHDLTRVQLSELEIENYKVTKFDNKAVIRVDALNNGEFSVSDFPLLITYYTNDGKKIGADKCNLLEGLSSSLVALGKLTAEVSVSFPNGTSSIDVALDRGN